MTKRILVVDDDANIRRIITLALSDESPYEVTAVSSAEAALLQITRLPFDMLFTDINMPGMNGIELVQRVRELDLNIAVIVFTVNPRELTQERAAELKIDCLLEKPVSPDQLRLVVDLLLDPMKLLPRKQKPAAPEPPPAPAANPAPMPAPAAASSPPTTGGPLAQRISQMQMRQQATAPVLPPDVYEETPIAVRLTPGHPGATGRNYSNHQIESMRNALRELALEPDVHCALLTDISGIVLTHWSRRRDINVTVVAALAAGNSLALAEIGRNLGQKHPSNLVIQEGQDQSIIMAQVDDLLLLLAIGPNASLGWARITTMRTCEELSRIVRG